MADLEAIELERYKYAKQKVKEYESSIENCYARIADHEEFIARYQRLHKLESDYIALCEKKLALP